MSKAPASSLTRPLRIPEDGWRDENDWEWALWTGRMVECPRCAFMFGETHKDDAAKPGYSCPNCDYDGSVPDDPNVSGREGLTARADELRKKCEARIPGLRKIVQDGRDSGDPDRFADAAYVLGWMDEVSDYVGVLRELADV